MDSLIKIGRDLSELQYQQLVMIHGKIDGRWQRDEDKWQKV